MDAVDEAAARRLWRTLEPCHALVYFVPEAAEEYTSVGLKGSRMGYFASRSAPLGPVPAEVVVATFFNFHPSVVHKAIPDAWALASPADIVDARWRAVDRASRRIWGDEVESANIREAAELARTAAGGCFPQGRPLYAGHAALTWPTEPHLVLWHAISLLREFRGDGHIAALVSAGIGPCEALHLHGTTGEFPVDLLKLTRAWPDDEWDAALAKLVETGLMTADGGLTETGSALRQRVEDTTDQLALAPWTHLGAAGCRRLGELGAPLARAVIDSGGFPLRR